MEKRFHLLKELYDKILAGLPLTKDGHGYTALLNLLVPFQCLSVESAESYPEKCPFSFSDQCAGDSTGLVCLSLNINSVPDTTENGNHQRETTLLQLTLIDMLITKVQNPGLEDGTKQKYLDIIRILVKDASIDSKLIFALRSSDRLMSHVACKSLVSLVHFQLREEGTLFYEISQLLEGAVNVKGLLNDSWLTFCSETLSGFPSSCWIAECLWTLTNIIREILKEESSGTTGGLDKLLSPLDGILEGFYHRVLSQVPDLDKSLPASFHQRKSVVLLKRGVLCKAGEDLVKKASPPFLETPISMRTETSSQAPVLQFVNSGWLYRLSVGEKVAHFGGSQVRPELDICNGPDRVFLRALSLVLLKALEIRVQSCTSECEAQGNLILKA
uniref:Uncharacterized protein n=1 Tax=Sphaerodactylus townsendi TaxID=933632 RepID=A0ACB8E5J6_9SAUR